ncbi:MAG: NAD-glutamate dehydrogenase [Alphaproteobacteria bacterium]|nr:NAD-glutamate dehydrogenase [Alphaproteobacteria bacterium]
MKKQSDTSPQTAEKLVKAALAALPAKASEGMKDLLKLLAKQIPDDDVPLFDGDILAHIASTHWDLAKERHHGDPVIKIYSPPTNDPRHHRTVIDIVSNDMAFLVDSAVAEVNRHNILIDHLIHPILFAEYDSGGKLKGIYPKDSPQAKAPGAVRQSHICIQVKDLLPEEVLKALEQGMLSALHDVHFANRDWPEMIKRIAEAVMNWRMPRPATRRVRLRNFATCWIIWKTTILPFWPTANINSKRKTENCRAKL